MTKREFMEGGIVVLGIGFIAWGLIHLVMNVVGWTYLLVVGNQETVGLFFAADFIRQILANILQCAAGACFIIRNRQIADFADKMGQKG